MRISLLAASFLVLASCGPAGSNVPGRTSLTEKWLARSQASFKSGDFEDAEVAAIDGLKTSSSDPDLRLLAAKTALAKLEYKDTLKYTEGLTSPEALGLRGRALWYMGRYEEAGDTLDAYLRDPNVKDPWAKDTLRLAHTASGRQPFKLEGSLVSAVEMPRAGHAIVVPCELDGERIFALVTTANAGLIVDSNARKEPSWVGMRFGDIEVQDVPALVQDLSPLSEKLGAQIKALIGVELLRHLHVTFDRRGDQFVVRKSDPVLPSEGTKVRVWYLRGGAMVWRGVIGKPSETNFGSPFLVDTSQPYLVAFTDESWKKAGVDLKALSSEPGLPAPMKSGIIPEFRVASFDFSGIPGIQGFSMDGLPRDVELGGVFGASLISSFRVTLLEDGKFAWLEPDPTIFAPKNPSKSTLPEPPEETPAPPPPAKKGDSAKDTKNPGSKSKDAKAKPATPAAGKP